ncbi:TIGR02206 family membrane protein [Aeromicrobium phragmitis]|uniref:TIGR02206 family membrane protein n=1 Tax=Aeromicrobium phragmitis TaxID=2478914 RepID=A0A3L8PLV2_9ACTN|nr:TIGR02206 family membrane protein [Aeromicrobium phragmitis]RLV55789.1 TIGR02206 family membrane protein [Aeromicrobium phragmitis]
MTGGEFEPYGVTHLVMLAIGLGGVVPVAVLGRRHRDDPVRVSRWFAVALVGCTVPLQVIDHLPGNFDLETSLPIQLCDIAAVAAVVALWTHRLTPVALTYYWGLLLTPQALLTPALASDFPDPKFLAFWAMHILVIWAAVFLTVGLGLRPTWSGLARTAALTAAWMAVMYPVNVALGTNYGFVNAKPSTGSFLDLLGPWPFYLLFEALIVAAVWALMTWPWTRRRPADEPSSMP